MFRVNNKHEVRINFELNWFPSAKWLIPRPINIKDTLAIGKTRHFIIPNNGVSATYEGLLNHITSFLSLYNARKHKNKRDVYNKGFRKNLK